MHEQSDTTAVDLDYPFDKPRKIVLIGFNGSCNGLVCIMVPGYIMYLWNPATRKSMELPLIKMRNNVFSHTCGIGYDDSIDDYKVVVILSAHVDRVIQKRVEVYTLRTDSWRRIRDCPHSLKWTDSGIFVSGALHWTSSIMHEQSDTTAVDIDYPFEKPRERVWIDFNGSCNGLVCIMVTGYIMYVWNPATRKSTELPVIKMLNTVFNNKCGIGYDDSIDDYKVVVILSAHVDRVIQNRVEVYTLRTDSWRRIGDCPHSLAGSDSGIFVSGVLHWTSRDSNWIIVSLDLAKETYGEVLQPDYDRVCCLDLGLGVLSGCLCLLRQYDDCADVWVMKDYGIRESWTKLIAIPYLTPTDDAYSIPLCILKNNEVLVDNGMHLVRYCPKDAKFSYPKIQNCFASFSAYPYVESLVSPNSDDGIHRQQQY
ncbi:hypothetical protein RHGRI_014887 [Rhododendron griersonianum]|uniref:F-box/kelch-repeat protein n=1 Tax=Rhododendron griersonianum TaxID=479676 RepID=A0AAV6KBP9_9ERIC|nr:hypothetical protein RHGRI_014887 [Rhododendron griersonianum]